MSTADRNTHQGGGSPHRISTNKQNRNLGAPSNTAGPRDWVTVTTEHGKGWESGYNLPHIIYLSHITFIYSFYSLSILSSEISSGRHFGGNREPIFHEAARAPDAGSKHWGTADAAACWHWTPEPRIQDATGHQDTTGDGDCTIQKAAGWRGRVRKEKKKEIWAFNLQYM